MTIRYRIFKKKGEIQRAVVLLLSVHLFYSCSVGNISLENSTEEENWVPIAWNIISADETRDSASTPKTRALVNTYAQLRNLCTQDEDGSEKIGLYGSYTLDNRTVAIFENADLWWWAKENGNPFNDVLGNRSLWNYEGESRHWQDGADYSFRAYFPKSKVVLQPGSDVNNFLVVYDTQVSQYDLMVASRSLKAGAENPVQLLFQHTLAAVMIDFQFSTGGVSDKLTACWFENAQSNGLYTSSTLNYGTSINWPNSTSIPVGTRMYYWEPTIPMHIDSGSAVAAYSTNASPGNGMVYSNNEGWLLMIPQEIKGTESLKFCFKTTTGGEEVYRVGIPETELKAGYRYTFHIKISSTDIELKLTIKEWNELKSSYEIDLNK